MMRWVTKVALILLFLFSTADQGISSEDHGDHDDHGVTLNTGRYAGLLETSGSPVKIRAELVLFYTQVNEGFPQLSGILKLRFGGPGSPEYVAYNYEKVFMDPNTNLLTLEAPGADLMVRRLMVHCTMLMGEFRSKSTGQSGRINLYYQRSFDLPPLEEAPPKPTPPDHGGHGDHGGHHFLPSLTSSNPVSSLTGEYQGRCDGQSQVIQLLATRRTDAVEQRRSAFADYHVSGSLARISGGEKTKISAFAGANYNFFTGDLNLEGTPKSLNCRLSGSQLNCGPCKYEKKAGVEELFAAASSFNERGHKVKREGRALLTGTPEPKDIDGDYSGYLHHELLDSYQYVKFNVSSYKHTDRMHGPAQLFLSSSLELYLGTPEQGESIRYPFETRLWLSSEGAMALQGESEAFGVVREWRQGLILIDWYSRNFGRVGTIELVRGNSPVLPPSALQVAALGGSYTGPKMNLSLSVQSKGEAEPEPANPFFPLHFTGSTFLRHAGPELTLVEGSFDPYTGAFWLKNASGNLIWGKRLSKHELSLSVMGVNRFAYRFLPLNFESYRRQ